MFTKLFNYPAVISRHLNAPFARERESYLAHRAREGIVRNTLLRIARELLIIIHEMDLQPQMPIDIQTIESAAEHWARRQKRRNRARTLQYSRIVFIQAARDWLKFLGSLAEPESTPEPYAPAIQEFLLFMQHERGLSAVTIRNYLWHVRQFLGWFTKLCRTLDNVSVLDVDVFVGQHRHSWSRVTSASCVKSLRAFFRYAEGRGWCTNGIAEAIETPRIFKQESLPTGPDWGSVQKLFSSTESDTPAFTHVTAR